MVDKIKLIVLDVDGVLTDGKISIDSNGNEMKSFNVKDGMGISIAKFVGLKFAIISGRCSEAVTIRAKELKIDYVYQNIRNKKTVLDELIHHLNIDYANVCVIGDDINDLSIIQKSGLSFAPQDAVETVKRNVFYVTQAKGGEGAVREMIDFILNGHSNEESFHEEYINKIDNLAQ